MNDMTRLLVSVVAMVFATSAIAQANFDPSNIDAEAIEERLIAIKEELKLTDEQLEQIGPILTEGAQKRRAYLEENQETLQNARSSGRPNLRELAGLRRGMRKIDGETDKALGEVLDEEQLKGIKKLREEMRDELRQRAQER